MNSGQCNTVQKRNEEFAGTFYGTNFLNKNFERKKPIVMMRNKYLLKENFDAETKSLSSVSFFFGSVSRSKSQLKRKKMKVNQDIRSGITTSK